MEYKFKRQVPSGRCFCWLRNNPESEPVMAIWDGLRFTTSGQSISHNEYNERPLMKLAVVASTPPVEFSKFRPATYMDIGREVLDGTNYRLLMGYHEDEHGKWWHFRGYTTNTVPQVVIK